MNAGARRRSVAALTTPVPQKRSLKTSPLGASSTKSTVTPDAKRHMSTDSGAKTTTSTASSTDQVMSAPVVELFPATPNGPMEVTVDVEDTQIDLSPTGLVLFGWII